jgi:pectate lyase
LTINVLYIITFYHGEGVICKYTNSLQVMLFGASDSYSGDSVMQITVAFNHFGRGLVQRMPRVRWGFVHVVNNDYTHWEMYAIGGSQHPTIISQGNRFVAPPDPACKEVHFLLI